MEFSVYIIFSNDKKEIYVPKYVYKIVLAHMKKILQISLLLISTVAIGQENQHLKKINHIFWEENIKLKSSDFQNDEKNIADGKKYCDTIGLCTVGYFGIFSVLDIPKKKRKRGKLKEVMYIAPAFELAKSYRVKNDSLGVEKQQVVFDIYELSARWMRRELKKMTETMDGYGILSIWLKTVENDGKKMAQKMVDGFTYEVFIEAKPDAYQNWKKLIDEMLVETDEFKTSPEEIRRLTLGKPILEDYEMAKEVLGNLFD